MKSVEQFGRGNSDFSLFQIIRVLGLTSKGLNQKVQHATLKI